MLPLVAGNLLLWLVLIGLLSIAVVPLHAQQFSVAQWKHKDGLPSTAIHAVAQTPDGFLWLGTADGLVRYDGYQFVPLPLAQFGLRPLGQVQALHVSSDGALFAGSASGVLLRLKDKAAITRSLGSPILAIASLPDRVISITTADTILRLQPDTLAPIASQPVSPGRSRKSLSSGLNSRRLKPSPGTVEEDALTADLLRKVLPHSEISKVLKTGQGNLWVATRNRGVFLLRDGLLVQHFDRSNGLTSDKVWDLLEDREGNIWAGTQSGLDRLRPDKFVTFTERSGLGAAIANSVAPGQNGSLWVGSSLGLHHFSGSLRPDLTMRGDVTALLPWDKGRVLAVLNGSLQTIAESGTRTTVTAPSVRQASQIAQSSDGLLWLYSREAGLQQFTKDLKPELIDSPLSLGQSVTAMAATRGHNLWLGLASGKLLFHSENGEREFTSKDNLPEGTVTFLAPQADGTLWVATDGGLGFYDGQRLLRWDKSSGLPGNRLLWALPDRLGHLWLGYNFGVAEVSVNDLVQQAGGKIASVVSKFYDDGDGLQGNPEAHGSMPVTQTTDGKIWFTMSEGVAMIDPAHITRNLLPPPTHILQLTADGTDIPLTDRITIKPLTRTLTFSYVGISLSEPRKVQYRYRLDGFDNRWQDAAGRHNATYTNLRPGSYRFRVVASNNDGVWDETGASLPLQILPAYYQTAWFRTFCGVILFALLAAFFKLRIQRNAGILQLAYEARLAERTRLAQDLHDNLIQEMIGVGLQLEIADEVTPDDVPAKKFVNRALELVQDVIGNGRTALHKLRQQPMSLAELRQTIEDTAKASSPAAVLQLSFLNAGAEQLIQTDIAEEIAQIAREAVRNAVRYAAGSRVVVQTEYGIDRFSMIVSDQGPGISKQRLEEGTPGHYGMRGMRERALRIGATLDLRTSPGSGTEWRLTVPGRIAYQPDPPPVRASMSASIRSYIDRRKKQR